MSQSNEHNILADRKKTMWLEQYTNLYTLKKHPVTEPFIERISADLIKWAKEDKNALTLSQFYLEKGIPYSTFKGLMNRFPMLKMARDSAMEFMGNRREIGALKNKMNPNMVMSQQANYAPSWMELEVKRSDLRIKSQEKINPDIKYVIALEDFSKEVKKKTHNLPEEMK